MAYFIYLKYNNWFIVLFLSESIPKFYLKVEQNINRMLNKVSTGNYVNYLVCEVVVVVLPDVFVLFSKVLEKLVVAAFVQQIGTLLRNGKKFGFNTFLNIIEFEHY